VQYLHEHDYHEAHPWLVKFDNENLIGTAQRLSLQGKHDQSLEMFDSLLKKKQQLATSPPKAGAVVPVGDSSSAEVAQELLLIGKGKFISMLGKARSLVMKAKYVEARDLLLECTKFPVDLLGDAEDRLILTAEMKTLMTRNALQSADFDKAAASRVETLQMLVDHYGPDSEKLVGIMILIAQSYRALCSYDEAETFINEVNLRYRDVRSLMNDGCVRLFSVGYIYRRRYHQEGAASARQSYKCELCGLSGRSG